MSRSPGKPVIEFDHLSARYAADPLSVYREMRSRCPVAWTDAHYALADGAVRYSNIGTANGWHRLPARFAPGKRAGSEDPA